MKDAGFDDSIFEDFFKEFDYLRKQATSNESLRELVKICYDFWNNCVLSSKQ